MQVAVCNLLTCNSLMRIGFFGGSFDPPHRGHLAMARAAADACALDRVLLAPVGLQPLKPDGPTADFADRLAMVELLCWHDARLEVSALDAPRSNGQPNYTVDTLRRLRAETAPDDLIFVLIGADSLRELPRWRAHGELLHLAEWIAISRPGLDVARLVAEVVPAASRKRIHVLTTVDEPVSATEIRARLRDGLPCDDLLLPEVEAYINARGLYRSCVAQGVENG